MFSGKFFIVHIIHLLSLAINQNVMKSDRAFRSRNLGVKRLSESSEVLRKLEGKKNNLNLQLYVIEEEQSSITIMKSVDNDENVDDVGEDDEDEDQDRTFRRRW